MSRLVDGKLECCDVSKVYVQGGANVPVFKHVSAMFTVASSYAITGVSGSGKSTLLHLLSGLENPTSGMVTLDGANIAHFKSKQRQNFLYNTIGLMFQMHYLIQELTVLENVMLAGMIKGDSQKNCTMRAESLLELVGLASQTASYPARLSGGQLQRVSLARALFNKPAFLLADEPTGSLDADNAVTVMDLLFQAQQEWGMGIIVCTHDTTIADRMAVEYRVGHGEMRLVKGLP